MTQHLKPTAFSFGCLFHTCKYHRHGSSYSACRSSSFSLSCHKITGFRKVIGSQKSYATHLKTEESDVATFNLLHVQTLRNYPREKLSGKVVAVRLDSSLFLNAFPLKNGSASKTLHTIKYLHDAGSIVLLLSSWNILSDQALLSEEIFADRLSSLLQLRVLPASGFLDIMPLTMDEQRDGDILLLDNLTKFKEDSANCSDFSKKLSTGVGVFVNDAFSLANKIHASTVGISRFCYSSVAGFHFEEELNQLASISETTKRPYVAIIGGKKFLEKRTVLRILATKCDGLLFIGKLSFLIMHALGMSVPLNLVENDAIEEALDIIQLAKKRKTDIIFPDDFLCVDDRNPDVADIFPCDGIQPGWTPVDLGPDSWKNISSRLLNCKKVLLIGPMTFKARREGIEATSMLSIILERISHAGCDVAIVGNAGYKPLSGPGDQHCKYFENASVVWDFLKGRTLPGIAALDRAFPFDADWGSIFEDPTRPLVIDVGSGNGLFLFGMAERRQSSNFLGLETNQRLVLRCLDNITRSGTRNIHFLPADAASTFHSIVSSYPGDLVLVSIQCPNPDFNKPEEQRWRMVGRMLIEAVAELLVVGGEVFLQSDVEEVARRMKEDFAVYGKGVLALEVGDDSGAWLRENPFGVRSDWERHVLARGRPMFRVLLKKRGHR